MDLYYVQIDKSFDSQIKAQEKRLPEGSRLRE